MNRYIGLSILPLLISHAKFYNEAENYSSLLDATLHTVYRLSKNRMLTKGQREAVSDFLVALTSSMQPAMLLKLLRKLTVDVSKLSEYTTVALRVSLFCHYRGIEFEELDTTFQIKFQAKFQTTFQTKLQKIFKECNTFSASNITL